MSIRIVLADDHEVLQLITRGYADWRIGKSLRLSVRTVESHRANFVGKLTLQTLVQIVRCAAVHRLFHQSRDAARPSFSAVARDSKGLMQSVVTTDSPRILRNSPVTRAASPSVAHTLTGWAVGG